MHPSCRRAWVLIDLWLSSSFNEKSGGRDRYDFGGVGFRSPVIPVGGDFGFRAGIGPAFRT